MSNRLRTESSPYLLQHAENPVDWYPWGPEAFERARSEDKPIFLSVGYSACHWCHVMEHESFEDEATAALMNERFVSIKVDREERPDVDAIYMDAVSALTGRGGWPMSVFLTPDAVPFYGGTYFPPTSRYGMPSFTEVLTQIASLWDTRRDELVAAGEELRAALGAQATAGTGAEAGDLEPATLIAAQVALARDFDPVDGGWGAAPKFPQPPVVDFVLRRALATGDAQVLEMATVTLDAMLRGGMYDQLGGGFHRYSTDERWLVPHFEKMLYDNAQLARVYLHAYQVTGTHEYRRVVTETLDYVAREMLDAAGGFYSAQDADTEGEEGRYFVWTPEQIEAALVGVDPDPIGDAELFALARGVTASGNFEGKSILTLAQTAEQVADSSGFSEAEVEERLDRARRALLIARDSRVKPGLDHKVLASWNGLMLAAFAEAARVLARDDYRAIAEKNAEFVLEHMRTPEGRLLRSWPRGGTRLPGYLEDHAAYAAGLLELYQTTFDPRWFQAARDLAEITLVHFADSAGGFFDTSDDHESLLLRPKTTQDGALPSGAAMAAEVLIKLAEYTGEHRYSDAAVAALAPVQSLMARAPLGFAHWLGALDLLLAPPQALAIVGEESSEMLDVVRERWRPNLLVAVGAAQAATPMPGAAEANAPALLNAREAKGRQATAYLCRGSACEPPVSSAAELGALLA